VAGAILSWVPDHRSGFAVARPGCAAMRANSLALRLFLTATLWTAAILLITGIVLSTIYRQTVERAFDRRLDVYLKTLVADVASPETPDDKFPQSLGEPLFELPLSGWYWQVTRLDPQKPETRSSRSLWDAALPRLADPIAAPPGGTRQGYVKGPEDQRLRLAERTIDFGEEGRYLVAVAGDAGEIDDEIRNFDWWLAVTFLALAAVLLLSTLFQVRFGLAPLKRISESLAAIRSGSAERLAGKFPEEIAPLARETNALIEANREIVERARTHVGNLAHALKTPLSVMVNEAAAQGDDALAAKVREQVDIMRDQVARHLERARLAARTPVVATVTEVVPVLTALARTMEKLHRDRAVAIDIEASQPVRFQGEQQDLEEMLGNLVDNACKWAQSRVSVEVMQARSGSSKAPPTVHIIVDDDGPGLSPSERERVAKRGQRLDETKPGSGLGLSIVAELARLYGGGLTLGTAPIGGLRAELVLPGG
jgi:signal transduction histidine kinase